MQLTFKLKPGKTIRDAAIKVQLFNEIAKDLLVNGPIKCNPDSANVEDMIGDVVTPANEYGYATTSIGNYRKLILDAQMLAFFADTFEVVVGSPTETNEQGVDVDAGVIA